MASETERKYGCIPSGFKSRTPRILGTWLHLSYGPRPEPRVMNGTLTASQSQDNSPNLQWRNQDKERRPRSLRQAYVVYIASLHTMLHFAVKNELYNEIVSLTLVRCDSQYHITYLGRMLLRNNSPAHLGLSLGNQSLNVEWNRKEKQSSGAFRLQRSENAPTTTSFSA